MAETANGSTATFTPKNILITGGCGFIASHVVIRLVKNYPQYKARELWREWGGMVLQQQGSWPSADACVSSTASRSAVVCSRLLACMSLPYSLRVLQGVATYMFSCLLY
jgi:hypothetical protein